MTSSLLSTAEGSSPTAEGSPLAKDFQALRKPPRKRMGASAGSALSLQGLNPIDFSELLQEKDATAAIQRVPEQSLYIALVHADPEECLEVLPKISREQWLGIVDLDAWRGDRLSFLSFSKWLRQFQSINPGQGFERFKELDEEYQLALLGPYIQLIDLETYEAASQAVQDSYTALPGNELFYQISSDNKEIYECIESLVQGGLEKNIEYLLSLLSHAFFLPPHEQEELISRFRNGRLQDLGFLPAEETSAFFPAFGSELLASMRREYEVSWNWLEGTKLGESEQLSVQDVAMDESTYFEQVLSTLLQAGDEKQAELTQVQQQLVAVTNGFASALGIDPGDTNSLALSLKQVHVLVSLALEHLSQNEVPKAIAILKKQGIKKLLAFGYTLVLEVQTLFVNGLSFVDQERYKKLTKYYYGKQTQLLHTEFDNLFLEDLGLQVSELLKNAFRILPRIPLAKEGNTLDSEQNSDEKRYIFEYINNFSQLTWVNYSLYSVYKEVIDDTKALDNESYFTVSS